MALPSGTDFPKETHYRRGVVMGLTVAEAFMLVAFILMMTLLFWRLAIEEETKGHVRAKQISLETINILIENPKIEQLVPAIEHLREDTRRKLGDLVRRPYANEAVAVAQGLSEADLGALRRGAKLVDPQRFKELKDAEELAKRFKATSLMIEKIEDLKDALRQRSVGEIEDALAVMKGLSEADRRELRRGAKLVDPQRFKELKDAEELAKRFKATNLMIEKIEGLKDALRQRSVGEIEDALAITRGLSEADLRELRRGAKLVNPQRLKELEDAEELAQRLHSRLTELLNEEDRARKDLVDELKRDLGTEIRVVGGRIDEFDGTITFPENALFSLGRDDILPRFSDILDKMCPIWLKKLRKFTDRREIEEILIEGHSSSEWNNAPTKRDAWVLNLDLSQRRAQAVLVHCLKLVEGTLSGEWSRAKLAAIGYSSSRPVLENGRESLRKSRRAVFGMRLSREQLRQEILKELQKENRGDVAR